MTAAYSEKLKDPRWQKKRLEIFQRDAWHCQKCHDADSTLVVHHRLYLPNTEPWDYPDELLITLCENCHEEETNTVTSLIKGLGDGLRKKFFSGSIIDFALGIEELNLLSAPGIVSSVYGWALADDNIQKELTDRYYNMLES